MSIPSTGERLKFYSENYASCTVHDWASQEAARIVEKIGLNGARYETVGSYFGIPGGIVGILHMMECSGDFTKHLANGDPLERDTVHAPANLMHPKAPPYSWVDAAIAALRHYRAGWGSLIVVSNATALRFFENYNGCGAWEIPGAVSPYCWSGTSIYTAGKFASDGKWDPNEVSKQVGVVPILKAMSLFPAD